eukprot:TRINITY_DN208_c0_g1_i4.p1 TRINITY_DN208_c0_g1~~TRINITY_DN208_c0_g1_i4.p1  ORF type:complete len:395 (-),score=124.87 TRINITY_DN208_c0_g1_i4:144-1328(-)
MVVFNERDYNVYTLRNYRRALWHLTHVATTSPRMAPHSPNVLFVPVVPNPLLARVPEGCIRDDISRAMLPGVDDVCFLPSSDAAVSLSHHLFRLSPSTPPTTTTDATSVTTAVTTALSVQLQLTHAIVANVSGILSVRSTHFPPPLVTKRELEDAAHGDSAVVGRLAAGGHVIATYIAGFAAYVVAAQMPTCEPQEVAAFWAPHQVSEVWYRQLGVVAATDATRVILAVIASLLSRTSPSPSPSPAAAGVIAHIWRDGATVVDDGVATRVTVSSLRGVAQVDVLVVQTRAGDAPRAAAAHAVLAAAVGDVMRALSPHLLPRVARHAVFCPECIRIPSLTHASDACAKLGSFLYADVVAAATADATVVCGQCGTTLQATRLLPELLLRAHTHTPT